MAMVSVIVPVFNVENFLGTAIDSALAQTWSDLQIIIVDDGSTDSSSDVARARRETAAAKGIAYEVVRQVNAGAGAARNTALGMVRGELVIFLDADDVLYPEAVEQLASVMLADPKVDLAFPLYRHIDEAGSPMGTVSKPASLRYGAQDLLFANPIHSGTAVMTRQKRICETGQFDTSLPSCIDLDFWVRLTSGRGKSIAVVPRVLADYRRRRGQITSDWRRMRRGWEAMISKADGAGYGLANGQRRAAVSRNALYWSTTAYQSGDYASARALALEMWKSDPLFAVRNGHAIIRSAACLASLLPVSLHDRLRDRFNGRYN